MKLAKAGELCCNFNEEYEYNYITGPDKINQVVFGLEGSFFLASSYGIHMKPLCWIEGKPVYKGDTVWHKSGHGSVAWALCARAAAGNQLNCDGIIRPIEDFTLTKPKKKVKHVGWVNVYPTCHMGKRYDSKEEAVSFAASEVITTVKIEWETEE